MQDESVDYGVEITSHPVEKGINISDHARRQPYTLNLRGEIVGEDAAQKRSQIEQLMSNAALISYQGRNIKTNGLIESFSTGHPNTIAGGCSFNMTIKEIRVANSSGYIVNTTPTESKTTPTKDFQETSTQKILTDNARDKYYKMRKGDSLREVCFEESYTDVLKIMNKNIRPESLANDIICRLRAERAGKNPFSSISLLADSLNPNLVGQIHKSSSGAIHGGRSGTFSTSSTHGGGGGKF